jgi:hypothetical protein
VHTPVEGQLCAAWLVRASGSDATKRSRWVRMHSLSAAQWAVRFFQRGSDLLERVELSGGRCADVIAALGWRIAS